MCMKNDLAIYDLAKRVNVAIYLSYTVYILIVQI